MLSRSWDLNSVRLSVRLFVCQCHTRALWRNERKYCRYFDTTWKSNHSSFLTPTEVGGQCPLPPEICAYPAKSADLHQYMLITFEVWTVKASEKCSIIANRKSTTRFPMSYRWSAYVTPNSPKGWFKKRIFVFMNKIQVQSNKFCYKLSLCENFQRQSCSRTIPLSNGV